MKRIIAAGIIAAGVAATAGWIAGAPQPSDAASLAAHQPDIENGKRLYTASGCLSCHLPAKDDAGADKSLPSGGHALVTPVGTFYPPNITPDPDSGIGGWTSIQFVDAVKHGISKALTLYEPSLRGALKAAGFLTRDARTVERKKYGKRKARRSFQFSKR